MKPSFPRGAGPPLALPVLLLAAVFVLPGSLQAKAAQEPTMTVTGTVSPDGQLLADVWRGGDRRVRTGGGGRLSAMVPAVLSLPQLAAAQDRRGISISFDSIRIRDEDDPIWNDEPYLIVTRFRMRLQFRAGTASIVPGTLRVDNVMSGQNDLGRSDDNWADEDNTYQLPPGTPHVVQDTFPWNEDGWVLGAVVVHMEEDGFARSTADLVSTKVRETVQAALSSTSLSVSAKSITAAVVRKIVGDFVRSLVHLDIAGHIQSILSAADPDDFGGVNVVLTATGPGNTAFFFAGAPPSSPEGALGSVRPLIATANVTLRFPAGDLSSAPWTARFTGDHRVNGTIRAWRRGRGVGAISAGTTHTCALTNAGGVKCWGDNSEGQLGDGTKTGRLTPVDVSGLTGGVAAVSAGTYHTCALTAAGAVKCWGRNNYGQLGDGTTTDRLTPVGVSGLSSGVVAISTGDGHSCALTSTGGARCWGSNGNGQLGDGTYESLRLTPVDVSGLTGGVAAISAGTYHTCALTAAGGVKCWGWGAYGVLGDGQQGDQLTPVDVSGLTGGPSRSAPTVSTPARSRTGAGSSAGAITTRASSGTARRPGGSPRSASGGSEAASSRSAPATTTPARSEFAPTSRPGSSAGVTTAPASSGTARRPGGSPRSASAGSEAASSRSAQASSTPARSRARAGSSAGAPVGTASSGTARTPARG